MALHPDSIHDIDALERIADEWELHRDQLEREADPEGPRPTGYDHASLSDSQYALWRLIEEHGDTLLSFIQQAIVARQDGDWF